MLQRFRAWMHARRRRQPPDPAGPFGVVSYAQEGEDLLLARLLSQQKTGSFVDVGAHHPFRFSTTYLFYQRGWRGLNIEPCPGSRALFQRYRSEDVTLELAVAAAMDTRPYFTFAESALNTCCPTLAQAYQRHGHALVAETAIPTFPLADVLARHWPVGRRIDFLNVDVEGLDVEVLASNDWSRYRPRLVVVEDLSVQTLDQVETSAAGDFLAGQGYQAIAKTMNTLVFACAESRG